ncbi:MAG: hypothetical protein LW700_14735 [Gemmataceae bacterium]|nr:hypothetical protein [Gemmataceae bacterium]
MVGIWLALLAPSADGPADTARAEELVRQLGDERFSVRQSAHDGLATLGMDAFGALNKGLAAADPEVARRCRELLDQLRVADLEARLKKFKEGKGTLPGYERYVSVVGETRRGREFFAEMWSANPIFLADVEERPDRAGGLVAGTAQNLMQNLYQRRPNQPGAQRQMVNLDTATSQISNILSHEQVRTAVLDRPQGETSPLYRLAVGFMRAQMRSPQTQNMLIHMCMNLNLKESVELAEVVLANRGFNPHGRGLACALVGKFGEQKDAHLLAAVLDDSTHINQFQLGQRGQLRGTTEVRDVALAQLVSMTRQSHKDYSFPFAEQGSQFNHFNTYNMGFTATEKRSAALTKWKAYAAARPELQAKTPLKEELPEKDAKAKEDDD